ncbi:SafA/ExsA family spore coat assembly protein [Niallia taxi]|uniref:SafA/ExsA family spore coat assembly protein n=1 Tax=Niallia taxi TaxID=2499688 RepID=UPI002E211F4C|nr:SafA/ExsA family spore coat assembly protein [Niallia taxi]MED4055887.1 SafA/ExsA family spore coat assembly protein [Niallia taxi]MED4117883.1 SafA/ExsA family spore coat assembly protein [Niallia taxi]
MKIHIVQKGDTLWEIAKKYGVNFEELKMLNSQLSNPDMIMPGMKVKVPTAGGSIKKEAPIAGIKKEQPIYKEQPIIKEKPIVKEQPKKEMPKKEMPKKEKPHTPKMPKPIIPEIDIHNYYSMNMTNVDIDVKEKPVPQKPVAEKPVPQKPVAEKPVNIAPIVKEEPKQEVCPPIIPYQPYCYEVSPMMPGSGFPPGVCIPEGVPMETYPMDHTYQAPMVMPAHGHGVKHKWEESSSSYNTPFTPSTQPFQHAQVSPMHGHMEMPVQQQPFQNYGHMPMHTSYDMNESSDYTNVAPAAYTAPAQMQMPQLPFKEDCGCGGPAVPFPSHTHSAPMGMQQGFDPGMGGQMPFGGNPGAMGMQQGFNPGMGGQMPFGGNPGAMGMQQGFDPGMGGQAPFTYPGGEPFGPGAMGMQQGFNPEMGGMPMTGGPGYPGGGGMPYMQEPPYPQGAAGNVPMQFPMDDMGGMQGMPFDGMMGGSPGTRDFHAAPIMGPGGNAPIFAPPFHGNGQPPLVHPYGINEVTPFGMPRYLDESSDYEI